MRATRDARKNSTIRNESTKPERQQHAKELTADKNTRKRCNKSLAKSNETVQRRGYGCDVCVEVCKMRAQKLMAPVQP